MSSFGLLMGALLNVILNCTVSTRNKFCCSALSLYSDESEDEGESGAARLLELESKCRH